MHIIYLISSFYQLHLIIKNFKKYFISETMETKVFYFIKTYKHMRNRCISLVIFCLLVNKRDFDNDLKGLKITPIFSIIQFKTKNEFKTNKLINKSHIGEQLFKIKISQQRNILYTFLSSNI